MRFVEPRLSKHHDRGESLRGQGFLTRPRLWEGESIATDKSTTRATKKTPRKRALSTVEVALRHHTECDKATPALTCELGHHGLFGGGC